MSEERKHKINNKGHYIKEGNTRVPSEGNTSVPGS